MDHNMDAQIWLYGRSDNKRFAIAFAASLLLEATVLAVLLPVMTHQRPPPSDTQNIVKLSVVAPAPPAPPAPPPPKPVVTPPQHVPPPPPLPVAPPLPPPPLPVAPHHPAIRHPPHLRHITPPPVQPPPQTLQAPTTPPPPAPAPAAPSAGELDLFQAAMRRAVQAAAVDPAAAAMSNEAGVVRVSFTYEDGAASNITVIGSSGFPLLDEAAREAVRDAHYPPQPPDFAGRSDNIVVDVIFRQAETSTDSD